MGRRDVATHGGRPFKKRDFNGEGGLVTLGFILSFVWGKGGRTMSIGSWAHVLSMHNRDLACMISTHNATTRYAGENPPYAGGHVKLKNHACIQETMSLPLGPPPEAFTHK